MTKKMHNRFSPFFPRTIFLSEARRYKCQNGCQRYSFVFQNNVESGFYKSCLNLFAISTIFDISFTLRLNNTYLLHKLNQYKIKLRNVKRILVLKNNILKESTEFPINILLFISQFKKSKKINFKNFNSQQGSGKYNIVQGVVYK